MAKSLFFTFLIFYLLILMEASFFVHFDLFKLFSNLALFLLFFIIFFQKEKNPLGFYLALFVGFLLDIFSQHFIGFYILICLAIFFFIKNVLKKYFYSGKVF